MTTHPLKSTSDEVASYLEVIRPTSIATAETSGAGLVGNSAAFNQMLEMASRAAPTDATVLLNGESGTGKELLAQAIHAQSGRAEGSFVPLDCSGLTESLFESEMFGHEKGAFTGAFQGRRGLVEASRGGTLFLDEVGDIPMPLQIKLLRLLETGTFRRVGSTDQREVDFRLVCATHRDLEAMTAAGNFRSDLYYRISAFPIRLPPLREHLEDLPLLIETLMARIGCANKRFHPDALAALANYDFPGNVRELLNLITRSCLLADGETILPEHLPEQCRMPRSGLRKLLPGSDVEPLDDVVGNYVRWAAARIPNDRRELARRLGLSERSLYRKLRRLRLARSRSEP